MDEQVEAYAPGQKEPKIIFADPPLLKETLKMEAAGKRLCGLCGWKAVGKDVWKCTNSLGVHFVPGHGTHVGFPCPVPDPEAGCSGFLAKTRAPKPVQVKPARLTIPEGVRFMYFGRPRHGNRHQGVMTVAYRISREQRHVVVGFSFCSPEDQWEKMRGQVLALRRLQEIPITTSYLYEPRRLVVQIAQATMEHRFQEVMHVCQKSGPYPFPVVPSWTKNLAKRLQACFTAKFKKIATHMRRDIHSHASDALAYALGYPPGRFKILSTPRREGKTFTEEIMAQIMNDILPLASLSHCLR